MKIPKLPTTPPPPRPELVNAVEVVDRGQYKVGPCDLVKGTGTALLHSGGLGPCIATAFYDPLTRSGYMHHEPSFALLSNKIFLAEIVGAIFRDYGDLSRLRVATYGCCLLDSDNTKERQHMLQSRMLVEGILTFYFGPQQLDIQWSPPNSVSELFLDIEQGEFRRESDDLFDILNFLDL